MAVDYPANIQLACLPTPLQPLRRLQKQIGGPLIWLKRDDLTGSVLSGNKVRKLEFILARAQSEDYDTIITCGGLQSNHCRAAALAAASQGMHCHLVLRGEEPEHSDGNLLLDELSGARISYYPAKRYFAELEDIFEHWVQHYETVGQNALVVPTGGSNGVGVWGYIQACGELSRDFHTHALEPQAIVCTAGSGGTQAGLIVGSQLHELDVPVIGINVCDDEKYFQTKIAADIREWQALYPESAKALPDLAPATIIDGYVGDGYAKASDKVLETIRLVAQTEGVVLDPVYTGKAFDAMLEEISKGRFNKDRPIVFVHTGGVYGLFDFKQRFALMQEKL